MPLMMFAQTDAELSKKIISTNYSDLQAMQAAGSSIKSLVVGVPFWSGAAYSIGLTTGQMRLVMVRLEKDATLTGIAYHLGTQGSYTANNYNGFGLYTFTGGTATLVASTTSDGTVFSQTAGLQKKAFSSTYAAVAGVYYIGLLYSRSAETTAPAVILYNLGASGVMNTFDFTNTQYIGLTYGSALTTLPSSITLSSATSAPDPTRLYLY